MGSHVGRVTAVHHEHLHGVVVDWHAVVPGQTLEVLGVLPRSKHGLEPRVAIVAKRGWLYIDREGTPDLDPESAVFVCRIAGVFSIEPIGHIPQGLAGGFVGARLIQLEGQLFRREPVTAGLYT